MVQPTTSLPGTRLIAAIGIGDLKPQSSVIGRVTEVVLEKARLRTKPKDVKAYSHFGRHTNSRVAPEAGSQSNWVSQLIPEAGYEVTVANAERTSFMAGRHKLQATPSQESRWARENP